MPCFRCFSWRTMARTAMQSTTPFITAFRGLRAPRNCWQATIGTKKTTWTKLRFALKPSKYGWNNSLKNEGQAENPMANAKSSGGGCTRFFFEFWHPGSSWEKLIPLLRNFGANLFVHFDVACQTYHQLSLADIKPYLHKWKLLGCFFGVQIPGFSLWDSGLVEQQSLGPLGSNPCGTTGKCIS